MFRPSIQKNRVLFVIALLSLVLFYIVSSNIIFVKKDDYNLKVEAASKMESALKILKDEIGRDFEWLDRDPFDTRLVFNRRFSPLLTDIGKYQAKATVLKPNFAAFVIDQFTKAGLQEGDTIAISMTGSMPGANIAVLIASEVMGLHYVSISSMGASEWGATDLNASWPRMEKILYENKLIKHTSNKFSYGGAADYVKKGSKSRQDYGGFNQREKLDSLIQSIYPNTPLNKLLLLSNLDSSNDQFSMESNKYLPIAREYYALPISIARRLEVYEFEALPDSITVAEKNQKLFLDAINDYGKEKIYFSNISIRTENDLDNNRKKNIYGKVPESLSALLKVCKNQSLECLEPTPYEKFDDSNLNGKWDDGEDFSDVNENGTRDLNKKIILNNKYRLEIKNSISQKYDLHRYKAYINVGGSVASFGYKNQERFEKNGYGLVSVDTVVKILTDEKRKRTKRGVISSFIDAGIPIINFIEIEKILNGVDLKYFNRQIKDPYLDSNKDGMIDIGKGNLYQDTMYQLYIVWVALIISLGLIIFVGLISYRQISIRMKDYNPND